MSEERTNSVLEVIILVDGNDSQSDSFRRIPEESQTIYQCHLRIQG